MARLDHEQIAKDVMAYVRQRIRERMNDLGLRQADLARLLGQGRDYISRTLKRVKRGDRTTIKELAQIADVLHMRLIVKLPSIAFPELQGERARGYSKAYYQNHKNDPEYIATKRKISHAWYEKNKEKVKAKARIKKWADMTEEQKEKHRAVAREYQRRKRKVNHG